MSGDFWFGVLIGGLLAGCVATATAILGLRREARVREREAQVRASVRAGLKEIHHDLVQDDRNEVLRGIVQGLYRAQTTGEVQAVRQVALNALDDEFVPEAWQQDRRPTK